MVYSLLDLYLLSYCQYQEKTLTVDRFGEAWKKWYNLELPSDLYESNPFMFGYRCHKYLALTAANAPLFSWIERHGLTDDFILKYHDRICWGEAILDDNISETVLEFLFQQYPQQCFDITPFSERRFSKEFILRYYGRFQVKSFCTSRACLDLDKETFQKIWHENIELMIQNPYLSEAFIEEQVITGGYWNAVLQNSSLSTEFLERHLNNFSIVLLQNATASIAVLEKIVDGIVWKQMTFRNTPEEFIARYVDKFQDEINWSSLCVSSQVSEEFLETLIQRYPNKINWGSVLYNPNVSEQFLEKYQNKFLEDNFSFALRVSYDFLTNHPDIAWGLDRLFPLMVLYLTIKIDPLFFSRRDSLTRLSRHYHYHIIGSVFEILK